MASAGVVGFLVLIYLDDVLIFARGQDRVHAQANVVVSMLRQVGAVINPKS